MSIATTGAELVKLRRRPGTWVVGGAWVLTTVLFAFVVPFLVYLSLHGAPGSSDDPQKVLDTLLPASLATTAASTYPMFGGAAMLVLGVLLTGGEYRWGTWTPLLLQGPSRTAVLLGKAAAAALAVLAIVATTYATAALASLVVGLGEHRPLDFPAPHRVLASLGAAWLISAAWAAVGMMLGVLLRGATNAVAVGLVWTLGVEGALSGIAGAVPALEPLRHGLLGANSGSLVAALGARSQSDGGVPGVVAVSGTGTACAVLIAYTAVALAVAVLVLRRRDVV